MPSKSSGRIEKVRKFKNPNPLRNTHRWESFSNKIAKFNSLQPLRKVRRHDLETEDLSAATSYLNNGLQKWGELNISKIFVAFRKDVLSMCESLPQILHFENKIMEKFDQYISMQETEALEPLLDLLTAFAHDLGTRFEKHYSRSLELLIGIAGKARDVEVIEWTFGALAFLFKYLSKLLVPNLTPTYIVISGILGKQRHPPHIARFAAEALSFLVKKAGAPSHVESSLKPLVQHIERDLRSVKDDRQFLLYRDGIMTMFAEAIKSTDHTIHSAGFSIFTTVLNAIPEREQVLSEENIWTDVVCGVFTSILHHSMAETFNEFEAQLFEDLKLKLENKQDALPIIKMVGTLAGLRKGSRVSNWPALVGILLTAIEGYSNNLLDIPQEQHILAWSNIIVNIAIVWHQAPTDALIPQVNAMTRLFTREPLMHWFIPFCSYFVELDASRFGSLFRGSFQKFITSHWSQDRNEELLCIILPKMIESHAFPPCPDKECCRLPQAWQDHIVAKFERLEIAPFPEGGPYDKDPQVWREICLPKYSALLRILELASVHPSTNARIAELLLRKLKLALRPSATLASHEVNFIISQCFHAYLRMSDATDTLDITLSPLLRAALPRFARSAGYLESFLTYQRMVNDKEIERQYSSDSSSSDEDPVIDALVENLRSPLHEIRLASLNLLKQLGDPTDNLEHIDTMIELESAPLAVDRTRQMGMLLRRLGKQFAAIPETSWMRRGLPSFLFGMLTVKLAPVWDDAIEALKELSQTADGELAVSQTAFRWLEVPSMRWTPKTQSTTPAKRFFSDFECTALKKLQERASELNIVITDPLGLMLKRYDGKQFTATPHPDVARSRALKVLNALPHLAEKKSRQLVPFFLSWADEEDEEAETAESLEQEENLESNWSLADRKGLLGVFSQFINPKVLYQHEKVYEALLGVLSNGEGEVQKLALKAILNWKQTGVKEYQENLEYLLDEARFKNELTVFLQGDVIQPGHRAELMPVLLRLLYGRTISKKGTASGRQGHHATRLAVIRTLTVEDMGHFLGIATGKLKDVRVAVPATQRNKLFAQPKIPERKQLGFLNMIYSMINELGANVMPYMETLLNAVLYCTVYACRHLQGTTTEPIEPEDSGENAKSVQSLLRIIRATGIKCLTSLFQGAQEFSWDPYQDLIVEEVVAPRLENLAAETTQGVSGIVQLFATWAALPKAALLLGPHENAIPHGVLPSLIQSLSMEKAKEDMKLCVLEMVRNLVKLSLESAQASEFNEIIKVDLLDPNFSQLLRSISGVLQISTISNDLLEACVETVLSVTPMLQTSEHLQSVLRISVHLLQQPPRRVSPKIKGRILQIVETFVSLEIVAEDEVLVMELYDTLSSLFSYFKDRENREASSRALSVIAGKKQDLLRSAELCIEMNSFKEGRINEPDYDRRLAALNTISNERTTALTHKQWLPILHNLIYFIRDAEEFGILSSNAADGLRRFISDCSACQDDMEKTALEHLLNSVIMPSIYIGSRDPSDTVRREYLRVLGFLLSTMPSWGPVSDLKGLLNDLQDDSSEPTFFFNILSPASARQLEAMQVLERANKAHEMSSQNLGQFFIPLLEHFIYGRTDSSDDHGVGANATTTIGNLALSLNWKHYRTILQRYIGYIGSRSDLQKQTIRLMGKFVDALTIALGQETTETDAMQVDGQRLSKTIPRGEQLIPDVMEFFLPPLIKHLHEKDESEVSYRVPVGVIIVKLLKLLPSDRMEPKLAGVLTDICHILRSKAEEARDMARETLVAISVSLGPSYFGFMLKQLRSALTKGYMLHVLSYTMHSMLVAASPNFGAGDLDYCLPSIVTVIMDDIFGVVGQEKDAEGYTNQMKEIKGSKSQDSMELVAKHASVASLIALVRPIQALLMQRVDLKMVRKIDALTARIAVGLQQNPAAESRDTLVFCYEVVQEFYNSQKPEVVQKIDPRVKRYLVQKGAKKQDRGKSSKHTYKLVRFAVDVLRSILRKFDSLRTPDNLAGFLPILGDAILDGEDEVKISTFRLLAVIVKVPFPNDDGLNIFKVAVKEATKNISTGTSTTTELSQAALKMLAVVLRERKDVPVKDAAIDLLLGKLKDDVTEPLYRHVTFNFLRSVLDRKIETAAVYDTMDHVGNIMIINDDQDTRDLARGAFFQFIREYPQKKSRWAKQLNFVVANLKYDREGGRLSVMEVIHLLLMKASDEFVQEVAGTCFLPLFLVLANDDSEKCQLAAAELIKVVFQRADKEKTQGFLKLMRSWLEKDESVQTLALKTFDFLLRLRF